MNEPQRCESQDPSPPALPRGFLFVAAPAQFRAADSLVARMPHGIRSKQKLLGALADRLRFPPYAGRNWDALEECLHDLAWLPEMPIVIVHEDLPFGKDSDLRRTYLDILRGAVEHHANLARTLLVVLPADL